MANPMNDDLTNPHVGGSGKARGFSHNSRRLKRDAIPSDYDAVRAHTGKTEHYKDLDDKHYFLLELYGPQEPPQRTRRGRTEKDA